MSYDPRQLSVVGYANGFTLWHFRSADAAADLLSPHYFDAGRELLRVGDFILVNLGEPGTRPHAGILAVASTAAGAVEVSALAGSGAPTTAGHATQHYSGD